MMAKSTSFLGSNEPLHIFQDESFENATMTSHAPMPAVPRPPRRPLGNANANANSNMVFNPPSMATSFSPHKFQSSSSPQSPLKNSKGSKFNMVAMAPPSLKQVGTDSLTKRPFLSKFKTGTQKLSTENPAGMDKENMEPGFLPTPQSLNLNIESYYQKPNGKRGLMEAAPISSGSRPVAKKIRLESELEETPTGLPPYDSFPPITDDGAKPQHSYAQLIGMAILRSPLRRLTLAQIYRWISDTYSFYHPTDAGWQNSIRHNLSLHKNFIKIERPKDDPGKGNYWAIEPGTEAQFLKEKPTRKSASAAENIPVMSTRFEPPRQSIVPTPEPMLPPPMPMTQAALPSLPTQTRSNDLSSDATIIASDNAGLDDFTERERPTETAVDLDASLYSPLPTTLHSSPPMPRHGTMRNGTPPPLGRNVNSSATRSHQRKFRSMDDSGYISSLESSVLKPQQNGNLLTSEAEWPRVKRGKTKDRCKGRAEEEIKLLRNSSPYALPSSSPLRQAHGGQMPPPLTPNIRFARHPLFCPPPSASPNTNLRIHRDNVKHILQSPCRPIGESAVDSLPWSPAFNLDESAISLDNLPLESVDFGVFADFDLGNDFTGLDAAGNGSPIKRTGKRSRLDRSVSSSALDDITQSANRRSFLPTPLLKVPEQPPSDFLETPSKAFEGMSSPSKMFQQSPLRNQSPSKFNNLPALPFQADWSLSVEDFMLQAQPEVSECGGLDLSQGFARIGSGTQHNNKSQQAKPSLGRSFTTNF